MPTHFYHKAMLGLPGRDEQIENYQAMIRAVARAGVPILGYHFMPNSVWRTERAAPGRGGAAARQFDMAAVEAAADLDTLRDFLPTSLGHRSAMPLRGPDEAPVTEDEMWENYAYFIKAVLPVAEEEGFRLALHPDDPPVPIARRRRAALLPAGGLQEGLGDRRRQPAPGASTSASAAARKCPAAPRTSAA